jgi:predicted glycosyltransferase involved in capsule biosynthesis
MIDLKDVTFIIPLLIDSEDRINNYNIVIDYLLKNFDTNIIVCESDKESHEDLLKRDGVNYMFVKNDDLFHRTRLLNIMTKKAKTDIIVNYDIDVVFKIGQYVDARNAIKSGDFDICYPYGGNFMNVRKYYFNHIKENNLDGIDLDQCEMANPNSLGGAFFFNKQKYIEAGLENENFVSWGFEDNERITRLSILGYRLSRINGVLYHLDHERTVNSGPEQPNYNNNMNEYGEILKMTKDELKKYIKSWDWVMNYDFLKDI